MFLINYNYYHQIIRQDLTNKFFYQNPQELPRIKQVNLNFGYSKSYIINNKKINLRSLVSIMISLKLITTQKGTITQVQKTNNKLSIKIKKGYPIGSKITLKKESMHRFVFTFLTEILPKIKNFSAIKLKKNTFDNFSFKISNVFLFYEIENRQSFLKNLPLLSISFVTTAKTQKELLFLLRSYKFPLA